MSRARGRTIVFANSIDLVDSLAAELASEGVSKVAAVHGRLPLEERDAAVTMFRSGDVEVLARVHNGGPRGAAKPATKGYGRKVAALVGRAK